MKCKNCGQEIGKKKFCGYCGRKRKSRIITKIILIIIALLVVSIGTFFIRGIILSRNAENVVVAFLDGYVDKDSTIAHHLVGQGDGDIIAFDNNFSQAFAENFTYEIESSKCVGFNNFVVNVKASTIDFEKLFNDSYNEVADDYSDDEFSKVLEEKIETEDYQIIELTGELVVYKNDDEYKILMNFDLADILTGGMRSYLFSMQEVE